MGASRHQVPKEFTSRQVMLWGLTPGESGDLLRPCFRQCGYGTQAGCFTASHGLCRAHRHMSGHTHTQTHRQVPREDLDPPLPQAQMGTEAQSGDQAPRAAGSQPRDLCFPSEEASAATPDFTN